MLGMELLGTKDAMATVAVKNLETSRKFYGDTLGLSPVASRETSTQGYRTGNSLLLVYESPNAGTNRATSVTWVVGEDVEPIVQALKAKGVVFEHYELPGLTRQGDVHVGEGGKMKVAWFRDPDGNILGIVSG